MMPVHSLFTRSRKLAITLLAVILAALAAAGASAHSDEQLAKDPAAKPAVLLLPVAVQQAPAVEPTILIGNRKFLVPGADAHFHNDRIYVPVEPFARAIGADWSYNQETGLLTIDGKTVTYPWLPAPHLKHDHLFAPIRALAETAGATVEWVHETRTVKIAAPVTTEVWVADQGTNLIHILSQDGSLLENIDLNGQVSKPHMVLFTPDYRYALTANMGSDNIAVIRAADRKVVQVLTTGKGAHAAVPSPDGRTAVVAHVSGQSLLELIWQPGQERYETGRRLDFATAPELADRSRFPNPTAICPAYTADSRFVYVTLGGGGLLVVDAARFEIVRAYDRHAVAPNGCGLVLSPDGRHMYANSGTPRSSALYLFDTETHELLFTGETGGLDAHGVIFTPDGRYLITLNRLTDNGTLFDPVERRIAGEFPAGDAPDLAVLSTDGSRLFLTLRGPNPATGTHDIAGYHPGVNVIDTATFELIQHISLSDSPLSDPHGIAARPVLKRP